MGWFNSRWEEALEFGESFARRKVLRRLSEEAARLLGEFSPAGLEHFIRSGLSLVEELARAVPPGDRRRYARAAQEYRELAATISDADILAEMERRIPEHVQVLRRHPTWFGAEMARIRVALFPVEVIRTRHCPGPRREAVRALPFLLSGLGLAVAVVGVSAGLREAEAPGGRTRLNLALLGLAVGLGNLGLSMATSPEEPVAAALYPGKGGPYA